MIDASKEIEIESTTTEKVCEMRINESDKSKQKKLIEKRVKFYESQIVRKILKKLIALLI